MEVHVVCGYGSLFVLLDLLVVMLSLPLAHNKKAENHFSF